MVLFLKSSKISTANRKRWKSGEKGGEEEKGKVREREGERGRWRDPYVLRATTKTWLCGKSSFCP